MITETDKAWVAGLLDSSGSYGISRLSTGSVYLASRLTIKNLSARVRFNRVTGTRTRINVEMRVGIDRRQCKEHCPTKHVHVESVNPVIPQSMIQGIRAEVILSNVVGYLSDPTEVIRLLEEAKDRRSNLVMSTIRSLHDLGWDVGDLPMFCPHGFSMRKDCSECAKTSISIWKNYKEMQNA